MAATVSASVDLIVKAFVDGLSVLSRIHEGRGNKKKKKHSAHNEQPARDVGRSLSKSLRRGHTDVQQEYERSLLSVGEQFAIGDGTLSHSHPVLSHADLPVETAQGSLLRVILKLNSGLVGIIHSFLDKKRPGQQLDYSALTNISDSTRRDAVGTLQQLSRRISMSHQHLQLPPPQPRIQRQTVTHPNSRRTTTAGAGPPARRTIRGVQSHVAKVVMHNSSQPQLALVVRRSRGGRPIASSTSSTADQSNAVVLTRPKYTTKPHRAPARQDVGSSSCHADSAISTPVDRQDSPLRVNDRPRADNGSVGAAASSTQPYPRLPPSPSRNLSDFSSPPASRVEDAYVGACVEPRGSAGDPKNLRGEEGVATLSRRRRALPTPTFYSVASTGTKLGEIPMHKWAVPFDFEEMERLNLEAEINGWPLPVDPQGKKPRFGFLKMFKKKGAETS